MVDSNLPIMPQPAEQQAYINDLVVKDQYNAFCVDCQNNRSSHANITYGTYICSECVIEHTQNFPVISYLKPLDEVWDPYQLQVSAVGGNKNFYEFMREY